MLLYLLLSLFSWSVQSEVFNKESQDDGKSSLVFVFDRTGSMHNDLRQLKESAEMILNTALEESDMIADFVFVPFHDPVVGPATVTRQKAEFRAALDKVRVYGGGDCPEKSLGGIQLALTVSRPRSFIYVLTDATASDHRLVGDVLDLVQRKQSQVVFVLTGHCNDLHKPSYQVYEQIAAASSGQVFNLNKTNVHKVLEMVRTSLKGRNVNLGSIVLPAGYNQTQGIPVDRSVGEVTVSVSGARPRITVLDPEGRELTGPPQLVTTLDLAEIMVVKVLEPEAGNWSIVVGGAGEHLVRVAALSNLTFDCGFSVFPPATMAETSRRPLKGTYNHMMVSLTESDLPVKIDFAEILDLTGRPLFEVPLKVKEGSDHIYLADAFIPPDDLFYIAINGLDDANHQLRRVGATAVQAKLPDVPFLSVPKKVDVRRHDRVTLRCDVESLVPVSAKWTRDALWTQPFTTSLQSTSVEYVIEDVGEEDAGSYRCVAKNVAGQVAKETEVELQVDPPAVSILPGNTTVLIGQAVTVSCRVASDALLSKMRMLLTLAGQMDIEITDIDISPKEDGSYEYNKLISRVEEAHGGVYTCEAANRGGQTSQSMNIKVQSRPLVQILGPHNVMKIQHSSVQLICHVENADRVQWRAPNGSVIMDLVINGTYNGMHEVRDLTEDGRWTCYGFRGPYSESDHIDIDILIKPSAQIEGAKNVTIQHGTSVQLSCNIVAKPPPRVIWHRETESFLNHTITPSGNNAYRSVLSLNGSAESVEATYFCIAENPLGIAEDSIAVYARRLMTVVQGFSDMSVGIYSQLELYCQVDSFPPASVRWSHNGTELVTNTNVHLSDDNTTVTILMVDFDDLGQYECEAKNRYETVKENGTVTLVGLEAPVLRKEPTQVTVRKTQSTKLTCCVISGKPEPILSWQFKSKSSEDFTEVPFGANVNENFSELIVPRLMANHSGTYRCVADNIVGSDTYDVKIVVQYPPEVLEPSNEPSSNGKLEVKSGEPVRFSCAAIGEPLPIVVWTKNQRPVAYSGNMYLNGDDLVIEKTSETDSGFYTCNATSVLGSSQKNFTLLVYVPPTVSPSDVGSDIDALEGQLVELPCDAYAVPAPTVRWLYEGKPVEETRKYVDDFGIRFVANLTDFGNYTCLIENEYGNLTVPFFLYIWVAPTVQHLDTTKSVVVGSNVSMSCDAVGFPIPTISWEFNENELVINTTAVSFNDFGNLYISNTSASEEGVYTCVATNLAGVDKKSTLLSVNEPPVVLIEELSEPYLATDNDKELIVPCNVTGKPKPYIAWKRDGKYLSDEVYFEVDYDGTLTIKSPKEHMSGPYMCVAKNVAGEANKTVQVEVYAVPTQLQADASEVTVSVVEGTNASIECPVRAAPRDVVKWYKGAKLVSEGSLLIPNVSRANASQYACAVANIAGSAFSSVSVVVEWQPLLNLSGQHVEVIRGNDWYFECVADAKPRAKIQWFFNNKVVMFEDRERLRLLDVEMHQSGTYECVASNVHGSARALYTLDVLVPPFISEFDLLEVRLKEGSEAVLDCVAKGSPQPQVKWTYNNTNWVLAGSSLSSGNLSADAEGLYRCDATNKAGSAYIVYNVSVVSAAMVRDIVAYIDGKAYTVLDRIEAVQGGRIRIACSSSGRPTPAIQWIKSGNALGENSDGLSYADLVIDDVRTSDAGVYTCVVTNDAGTNQRKIRLDILEQPRIFQALFEDRPTGNTVNLEILAGQAFSMHCHPYGNPQPEVYWFKDDVALRLFNDKMVSTDYGEVVASKAALYEQAGNYTCVARNKIGNTSLVYLVDVLVPPPEIKDSIRKVNARGGGVVKLACPVGGSPTPHVLWLRHPYGEIEHMSRLSLVDDNSTLVINNTDVSDSGNYSCVMTNKVGSTEVVFDVTIETPPSIAGNVGANIVESHVVPLMRSIVLKCDVKGHPSPKISWLKDTQQIREESSNVHRVADSSLLTLWRVSVKAAGQYICLAENVAGAAHRRFNVAVTVPGKWSAWSAWGFCNVTCGQGFQFRDRECQYVDDNATYDKMTASDKIILDESECKGSSIDKRRCHMPPCEEPQTARWSRWSRWSSCSATCGSGSQTRVRRCLSAVPCYGDNVQIRKCPNLPKCALPSGRRDVESMNSMEDGSSVESPYAPEETFEMQPELFDAGKQHDVEEVEVFNSTPVTSTLFHEVNVTSNLDFSNPGPCRPGFTYNDTTNTCDDIDECTIEYNACHSTQVCANSEGGYRCGCDPGYTSIAPGTRCLDVNECERGVSGCEVACVNVAGGYACACPRDLRLHIDGHHCVLPSLYRDPYLFQDADTSDYLSAYIDLPPKHSKRGRS